MLSPLATTLALALAPLADSVGLQFAGDRPPVSTAMAWSGRTHMYLAEEVLRELMASPKLRIDKVDYLSGAIVGKLGDYEIDPELLAAIRANPRQFRAGVMAGDMYPDIATGQQIIHPPIAKGLAGDSIGGHNAWLEHLWEMSHRPGSTAAQKAFVAGVLVHSAGDMFAHTLMNQYTGGPFSFDPDRQNAIKHVILENYISKRTPHAMSYVDNKPLRREDISIQGIEPFIYETMIRADRDSRLNVYFFQGADAGNSIPNIFSDIRNDLHTRIEAYWKQLNEYDRRIREKNEAADRCQPLDMTCSATALRADALGIGAERTAFAATNGIINAYEEAWRDAIDRGLKALPNYSYRIGHAFVYDVDGRGGGMPAAMQIAEEYAIKHISAMAGAPKELGEAGAAIQKAMMDIDKIIDGIVPRDVRTVVADMQRVPLDALTLIAFGLTTKQVEEFFNHPYKHFDVEMQKGAGTATKLDWINKMELKIADPGYQALGEYVDYRRVPAMYNTVVMTKLALLSRGGLRKLFKDVGLEAEPPQKNIMLGFIVSIDHDNQWHLNRARMPLAYNCAAYEQLFMRQTGEKGKFSSCAERLRAPIARPRS